MSANNKTDKINKTSEWCLVLLTIILIFLAFFLISCQKEEVPRYNIIVFEQKEKTNLSNESATVNITETNLTSITPIILNQSEEPEIKENETTNETIKEEEQGQEQIPARASAVEFYFLLKGKSYFKYTLKENELKSFNLSGTIISIMPVFIANDSVIFQIDDYTTQAVNEKEWFSTPDFELYVNYIYYRR